MESLLNEVINFLAFSKRGKFLDQLKAYQLLKEDYDIVGRIFLGSSGAESLHFITSPASFAVTLKMQEALKLFLRSTSLPCKSPSSL